MGNAGRTLDLVLAVTLFRRIGDVVGHRVVEQVHMLGDQGVLLAQLAQAIFTDVDAVQQDLPLLDIIETGQQAGDGALARAGAPHQGHRFTRLDLEADVVQRRGILGRVAEGDIAKLDFAASARQGASAAIPLQEWSRAGRTDSDRR